MLIVGIQNVTRKDGTKAIILHGVSRRSMVDGFVTNTVWTDPDELKRTPVRVGYQIRSFREGGYMLLPDEPISIEELFVGVV